MKSRVPSWLTGLGSCAWSAASRLGYRLAADRSIRLPVRVISVGNLQAGGAGKTPLVIFIAREALARGERVAVLTRGYRSAWEASGGTLAPGEQPPIVEGAPACGDEPALIRARVPEVWIGVGADRVASYERIVARAAEERLPAPTLVILDDGFQHWRIARDVNLLAVTSDGPKERLHRESLGAARRADLLLWTRGESRPPAMAGVEVPVVRFALKPTVWMGQGSAKGECFLLTTVADPSQAARSLEQAGHRVVGSLPLADHARLTPEVVSLARKMTSETPGARLAMTGKDWVKWRVLEPQGEPPEVFELEPEIIEGREHWDRVVWGG